MIFIAIKYLLERRRQTILTLLGVFFGTLAYVGVSGFFVGFQSFIVDQLVNNAAQVHIEARKDYLTAHILDKPFFGGPDIYVNGKALQPGLRDIKKYRVHKLGIKDFPKILALKHSLPNFQRQH